MSPSVAAKPPERATDSGVRLAQVLEEYLAGLEAGTPVSRTGMLAKYPELAEDLEGCLASLEFIKRATATSQAGDREEGLPGKPLGDFCLLREIGRGGMGVVYEAEQVSLRRRVALKVLPFASVLDPRQLQRFKNEAQAAAALDHPNIVHIYSVGADRGVHYYAMQYIEGQTLAQVIQDLRARSELGHVAEGRPSLSQGTVAIPSGRATPPDRKPVDDRTESYAAGVQPPQAARPAPAGAAPEEVHSPAADTTPHAQDAISTGGSTRSPGFFRAVAHFGIQAAEALDHAHQVGVVHRDIKPSNLMVSASGHLWITDLGLATTRRDPSISMTGDVVGTLRYMSPEQILGDRRMLDHRTDIYSLGLTLYELITLRPVYASENRQEVVRQVVEDEPPPPRRFNAAIPRDLETIVLKAMAKEPQARYTTAQEFADDLRRFSTDQPIHAKRPALLERASRWTRRNRRLAVATLVFLVLAMIGLSVSLVLIAEKRTEAVEALDRAEEQRRLARQAVDEMYTEFAQKWLANQPQMDESQRTYLQKALQFYQRLSQEESQDPEVQKETGSAYLRVGEIERTLGRNAEAEAALRQAIAIFEPLVADDPSPPETAIELIMAYNRLGILLQDEGRSTEAEHCYRNAIALAERTSGSSPGRSELVMPYTNLAGLYITTGRRAEAEDLCRAQVGRLEKAASQYPAVVGFRWELATACSNFGVLLYNKGGLAEAEAMFRRALALRVQLIHECPKETEHRSKLVDCQMNLSGLLAKVGKSAESDKLLQEAMQGQRRLVKDFPQRPEFAECLGMLYNNHGLDLEGRSRYEEALKALEEATGIFSRLARDYPSVPDYPFFLARSEAGQSKSLSRLGRLVQAEASARRAIAVLEGLVRQYPDVPQYQKQLASAFAELAERYAGNGRFDDAIEWIKKAIGIDKTLAQRSPTVPDYARALALHQAILARIQWCKRANAEARESSLLALKLYEGLASQFPAVLNYRIELARQWQFQGTINVALGNYSEAAVLYQRGIGLHEAVLSAHPELGVGYLARLGEMYYELAAAQESSGKASDSRHAYEKAVQRLEKYVEKLPKDRAHRLILARATYALGASEHEGGNAAEGRKLIQKALERFQKCADENPTYCTAHSDLAGRLLGCPIAELRDPARAALHAKKTTELAPQDPVGWYELGRARYRLGDWKGALEALHKSDRLYSRAEPLFFLAMAHWQAGQRDEARKRYLEAVSRWEPSMNRSASITAIRAEAGQLLGIADRASAAKDKPPETKPQAKTESNQPPPSKGQADRHPPKADEVVKPPPNKEDAQKPVR